MRYDHRAFIVVGLVGAIGGFLLIDNYRLGNVSIVGNAMTGMVLSVVPYRYVLLCSLCLIGFGLYRQWIKRKWSDLS